MHTNGTRSRRSVPPPQANAALPEGNAALSEGNAALSEGNAALPEGNAALPEGNAALPEGNAALPEAGPRSRARTGARAFLDGYDSKASPRQRLLNAAVAFDITARDAAMRAALAAHGYDDTRLGIGQALLATAQAQYDQRPTTEQARRSARQADIDATAQAYADYKRQIALARIALREHPAASAALGLAAPRQRRRASWQGQAQELYATVLANPALTEALAAYGISTDEIAESQRRVAALAVSQGARQHTGQQAAAATQARKQALAALDRWMHDFLVVARIALARHAT